LIQALSFLHSTYPDCHDLHSLLPHWIIPVPIIFFRCLVFFFFHSEPTYQYDDAHLSSHAQFHLSPLAYIDQTVSRMRNTLPFIFNKNPFTPSDFYWWCIILYSFSICLFVCLSVCMCTVCSNFIIIISKYSWNFSNQFWPLPSLPSHILHMHTVTANSDFASLDDWIYMYVGNLTAHLQKLLTLLTSDSLH